MTASSGDDKEIERGTSRGSSGKRQVEELVQVVLEPEEGISFQCERLMVP